MYQALKSVVEQTYRDLEIIVINDASTDNSLREIQKLDDTRITLIDSTQNKGLVYNLNFGLSLAKGQYIARMDADDYSVKDRIEKQVKFMEANKEIAICGTQALIVRHDKKAGIWKQPLSADEVKCSLLFFASFIHPTMMFRTAAIRKEEFLYDDAFKHAEDYELWCRMHAKLKMTNMPDALLHYRQHDSQVSLQYKAQQQESMIRAMEKHFKMYFPEDAMFQLYVKIATQNYEASTAFVLQTEALFDYLYSQNLKQHWFNELVLRQKLSQIFFCICTHLSSQKINTYQLFKRSKFNNLTFVNKKLYIKYLFKEKIFGSKNI